MKTSEQMTNDVLSRRDKAIKDRAAARRHMMRIGVPCAGCLALAAVITVNVAVRSNNGLAAEGNKEIAYITNSNGEKVGYYIDSDGEIHYIHQAIAFEKDEIYFNDNFMSKDIAIDLDKSRLDFKPMTEAELNAYYGTRLTLLSEKYPDWKFSNAPYGVYSNNGKDVWTENSVSYTSPDGKRSICIDINKGELPLYSGVGGDLKDSSFVVADGEGKAVLFRCGDDLFKAQFMRGGSGMLISASGIGEKEFLDIVREYLSYPDFKSSEPGNTNTAVIDVDAFNVDEPVVTDPNELREMTMNAVNRFFNVELDRLTIIHPEWTESHGKLGIYRHEENDGVTASVSNYYTINTINYVTEKGNKISVSVQHGKFAPVSDETFTEDKPVSLPATSVITEYDENGNIIGQTTPGFNPDFVIKPSPDKNASTINGYEALIYRDANGNFIADIAMRSRVRITAEGVTESEFLKILDEFTL